MSQKAHVMLDLESMDLQPTAAIISIGAVVFKGAERRTFYMPVDLMSSIAAGCSVGLDTVRWWDRQSVEARYVLRDPRKVNLVEALQQFGSFIRDVGMAAGAEVCVWGNGAATDNAILAYAYARVGMSRPWGHWNDRCYRTIAAGISAPWVHNGVAHIALDDAIAQADFIMAHAPGAVV